jgi:hypothetical protein
MLKQSKYSKVTYNRLNQPKTLIECDFQLKKSQKLNGGNSVAVKLSTESVNGQISAVKPIMFPLNSHLHDLIFNSSIFLRTYT